MVGVRADLALGREIERRLQDRLKLFRLDDVRRWAWPPPSTKSAGRRDLVTLIFGNDFFRLLFVHDVHFSPEDY